MNEQEYINKINEKYNNEVVVIGKFNGLKKCILAKTKYGYIRNSANTILNYRPSIKCAINKSSYFMNILKERHYDIYEKITPNSDYVGMNKKMNFLTKYGEIFILPSALYSGHHPNIRSAINKKRYFINMLKEIYGNKYKYIINNVDRKNGRNYLVCQKHGKVEFDNEYIYQGFGCPKCNNENKIESNLFYLIKLSSNNEEFYKLGISSIRNNKINRFKNYKTLGYNIGEIEIKIFENESIARMFELKLKQIIKPFLHIPKKWEYDSSPECFDKNYLNIVLEKINLYYNDIV